MTSPHPSPTAPALASTATDARAALPRLPGWVPGLSCWALAWGLMLGFDAELGLANQALALVLAGAVTALWLPAAPSLVLGALSVVAFNWAFVPPRGTFAVDTPQHALLLAAMLLVHAVVLLLMARLRAQARAARHHQHQAEQLRDLGERLRDSADPLAQAGALQDALAALVGAPTALLLRRAAVPATDPPADPHRATAVEAPAPLALGTTDADEAAGLQHCLRQGQAMGPGTGRQQALAAWYLPMRAATADGTCLGAALLRLPAAGRDDPAARAHAQALCDQMGQALQRVASQAAERQAQAQAQLQAVRNALLAAISHDYRTPLATILGAASSLVEQGDRLQPAQRLRLAQQVVQEVTHLSQLTDNTLQLARLDAPGVQLRLDWESAEDIVGTVMRRARQRDPARAEAGRLRARLEPGLPLLRCDAMLLGQLLDNLMDNACKHTPPDAPVELLVRRGAGEVILAVRDRGPGVPPAWREKIFEAFQRGESAGDRPAAGDATRRRDAADGTNRRGAGVGLAVCRAIARAHGGDVRCRARGHGGSSFECHLPIVEPPAAPALPALPAAAADPGPATPGEPAGGAG